MPKGKPIIQNTFDLRFSLTIPVGQTMPQEGWPVVLYAHGTGGDYLSYWRNGTASRYADAGLAVVSIDPSFARRQTGPDARRRSEPFLQLSKPLRKSCQRHASRLRKLPTCSPS